MLAAADTTVSNRYVTRTIRQDIMPSTSAAESSRLISCARTMPRDVTAKMLSQATVYAMQR